eukprot:scaffold5152_cov79-Skeletonema_dohrnii-CCMP3373.AAC.3
MSRNIVPDRRSASAIGIRVTDHDVIELNTPFNAIIQVRVTCSALIRVMFRVADEWSRRGYSSPMDLCHTNR